jgi:hypothetical protein
MTIQRHVAYLAAAAFAVANGWHVLLAEHVIVAAPPVLAPSEPLEAAMHRWYAWFVTTLPQERFGTGIAIVGMLCLATVGALLGDRLGRLPGYAVALGALVWTIGNILMLGGHRAVGLMATHNNPIETVNAINFTVDTVTETFELTGFALMGCGLVGFASHALRHHAAIRAWVAVTVVLGVGMLLIAVGYAAGAEDPVTWLQTAGGLLLLPIWLVWTAHLHPAAAVHRGRQLARSVVGGEES